VPRERVVVTGCRIGAGEEIRDYKEGTRFSSRL